MISLDDFIGRWRLERQIDDRLAGLRGQFIGEAVFAPDGQGVLLTETGILRYGDGTPMQAERRYLWRADGQGIAVDFVDGRAFHWFSCDQPEADHQCAPDHYRVRYEFDNWPVWRAHWSVTGPHKNYRMVSGYERLTRG